MAYAGGTGRQGLKAHLLSVLRVLPHVASCLLLTGCTSWYTSFKPEKYEPKFDSIVQTYHHDVHATTPATSLEKAALPVQATAEAAIPPDAAGLFSTNQIHAGLSAQNISLQDLMVRAIQHSSQIKVFSELPLIRETSIQEAKGVFDPQLFTDARYYDRDDPVGSILVSATEERLYEYDTRLAAGVRKKMVPGTEVYITQEFNRIHNNSEYLQPNPQAGGRLAVGLVQPLMKGVGLRYNTAVMRIAVLDSEIARHEYVRQAESHLLEVARSYWVLNAARGIYRAKRTASEEAAAVLQSLESRGGYDAASQQILRARAVVAERRADLIRSESALRNGVDRLLALVNDPSLRASGEVELIPIDAPLTTRTAVDLDAAALTALENRSEVRQAYLQYEAAAERRRMSRHELLPTLNVFAETYVAGLAEDTMGNAWDDQWDRESNDEEVSYMVGARMEIPLGNNAAEAQNRRRRLELRQVFQQLETTMETVMLDVKFSVREVETAYRDLAAKYESLLAARADLDSLKSRRDAMVLGGDANAVAHLNLVLDAQERRMEAEERFLLALSTYNTGLITWQRAQGTLLAYEEIENEKIQQPADDDRSWIESRKLPENILKPGEPK